LCELAAEDIENKPVRSTTFSLKGLFQITLPGWATGLVEDHDGYTFDEDLLAKLFDLALPDIRGGVGRSRAESLHR